MIPAFQGCLGELRQAIARDQLLGDSNSQPTNMNDGGVWLAPHSVVPESAKYINNIHNP